MAKGREWEVLRRRREQSKKDAIVGGDRLCAGEEIE
jgi:hypothetical protein